MLRRYLDEGRKIVVLEPSVLAMLRRDFKHLLDGDDTQALLAQNSFEPLEYLWQIAQEQRLDLAQTISRDPLPARHAAVLPLALPAADVQFRHANHRRAAGRRLRCGDLVGGVLRHGRQLRLQARVLRTQHGGRRGPVRAGAACRRGRRPRTLVASGISCHEQLLAGMGREVFHPAELLASTLGSSPQSTSLDRVRLDECRISRFGKVASECYHSCQYYGYRRLLIYYRRTIYKSRESRHNHLAVRQFWGRAAFRALCVIRRALLIFCGQVSRSAARYALRFPPAKTWPSGALRPAMRCAHLISHRGC